MHSFSTKGELFAKFAFAAVVATAILFGLGGVAYADEQQTPVTVGSSGQTESGSLADPSTKASDVPGVPNLVLDDAEGDNAEGPETPAIQTGFVKDSAGLRYVDSDGSFATGWRAIDGDRYYFKVDGYAVQGEQTMDGKTYYFDEDFCVHIGWMTWKDGSKSYFGSDGAAKSGWQTISGKRYYFDPANSCHAARWSKAIGGKLYYFKSDCSMHTGWLTWNSDSTRSYFGSDGAAKSGWQTISGKRYYFDPANSCHAARWSKAIGGKQYYFDSSCAMYTGLLTWKKDGTKSFYGSDGVMTSGWQTWKGKRYYIKSSTMRAVKYKQTIGGKTYYFDGSCAMHTGWLRWNSDGKWSYFGSDGVMYTGTKTVGGVTYKFGSSGKVTRSTTAKEKMITKAQGYSSGTKYLILVDRKAHKVGVFKGSKNSWSLQYYWDCVTGASGTPTIKGSYRTTGYTRTVLSTDSRARWCTQIWGGYFFHTILSSTNELGKSLSHGCIRLAIPNAQWIYKNVHAGTAVVIYN